MFGRRLLLLTFILAVVFASTVYSDCTHNGKKLPCDDCVFKSEEQKAVVNKVAADLGKPPVCPADGSGAESIGYGLGLMVASLFGYLFRQ